MRTTDCRKIKIPPFHYFSNRWNEPPLPQLHNKIIKKTLATKGIVKRRTFCFYMKRHKPNAFLGAITKALSRFLIFAEKIMRKKTLFFGRLKKMTYLCTRNQKTIVQGKFG